MYPTDPRWLVDHRYRHSQLSCQSDKNEQWWELLEIEEAIFDAAPTPYLMELTYRERQQLYENYEDRWYMSIGIKNAR